MHKELSCVIPKVLNHLQLSPNSQPSAIKAWQDFGRGFGTDEATFIGTVTGRSVRMHIKRVNGLTQECGWYRCGLPELGLSVKCSTCRQVCLFFFFLNCCGRCLVFQVTYCNNHCRDKDWTVGDHKSRCKKKSMVKATRNM